MRYLSTFPRSRNGLLLGLFVGIAACNLVGGIEEPILDNTVGTADGGRGGAGGAGGAGGTGGGGGAAFCAPGASQPCYSGPMGTQDIGNCKAGTRTCLPDGSAFGECVGEVIPAMAEDCAMPGDEDCNGLEANVPVCSCMPGFPASCATGIPGICAKGSGTCAPDGQSVEIGSCLPLKTPVFDWCVTPEDDDCDGIAVNACTGSPEINGFVTTNPNTNKDDGIFSVAVTPDGGFVVAGVVNGTIVGKGDSVSAGSVYVAAFKPDGKTIVWSRTFTATNFASARSVAVDQVGDVVVAGYYNGTIEFGNGIASTGFGSEDIFIVKLTGTDGAYQWHNVYGATNKQWPYDVDVDGSGNIFVTGTIDTAPVTFGAETFTPQNDDIFVLSLNPTGGIRWTKHFKGVNVQAGRAIVVLEGGDIVIGGDTTGDTNFGGGNRNSSTAGAIALARLKGIDGSHQWSKIVGAAGNPQYARALAVTNHKDANGKDVEYIALTGSFNKVLSLGGANYTTDVPGSAFVAEFNASSGAFSRELASGKSGGTSGSSVAVDEAGDVLLTAWTETSIDFGSPTPFTSTGMADAYVVKLDGETWQPRWIKMLTGPNMQVGRDIAVDNKGRPIVGGFFIDEIIFGGLVADGVGKGGNDAFVVRLNP